MTDATFVLNDFTSFDRRPLSSRHSPRTVIAAAALALGLVAGASMLDAPPPAARETAEAPIATAVAAATPKSAAPPARLAPAPAQPPAPEVAPLAFAFSLGVAPLPFERSMPLSSALVSIAAAPATLTADRGDDAPPRDTAPALPQVAQDLPVADASPVLRDVPIPEPRPPAFRVAEGRWSPLPAGRRTVPRNATAAASSLPPDNRSFLERFFGMLRPSGPTLAYAAPEDGLLGNARSAVANPALAHDRWTAVYDIAAHTVYLPDGTRLEAHSGLGPLLDDPRHVDARNRGATPPHLYDLQLREQPFHGVRALRLNPIGGSGVFGRTGLLAHTYMLGPKGDSNGCVSFKDYASFLQAYARGDVKRLAVVPGMG